MLPAVSCHVLAAARAPDYPRQNLEAVLSSKTRFDLVPFAAVGEIADALAYGADKYSANNWCRGTNWGRYFAALCRHVFAWWRGEDKDPESGLSHLAHAGCCLLFLMEYQRNGWGTDDRFQGPDGKAFTKADGISTPYPPAPLQQDPLWAKRMCWVRSDGLRECATAVPAVHDDDDGLD
jgi:hypothetical protein